MTGKQHGNKLRSEIDTEANLSKGKDIEEKSMGKRHVSETDTKHSLNEKAQALGFSAEEILRLNRLYKLKED